MKDIKDMIGHNDLKMTDRYTHLRDFKKVALQDKLAEHYNGIQPAETPVNYWWVGSLGNI